MDNFFNIDFFRQGISSIIGVFIALLAGHWIDKSLNKKKVNRLLELLIEEIEKNRETLNLMKKNVESLECRVSKFEFINYSEYFISLHAHCERLKNDIFSILMGQNLFFYIENNFLKNIQSYYNRLADIDKIVHYLEGLDNASCVKTEEVSKNIIDRVRKDNLIALFKSVDYIIDDINKIEKFLLEKND